MKRITVEMLKEMKACEGHIELFRGFLGDRKYCYPTPRNIQLAQDFGLDVKWMFSSKKTIETLGITEEIACLDPKWVYRYAREIAPSDLLEAAAAGDPYWAYMYARYISPSDILEAAAAGNPYWAERYANDFPKNKN